MSAPAWLSAAVETACNRYLALDPEARAGLAPLTGKVVALELRGLGLTLYFLPGGDGVQVLGAYEGEPDTWLRGTPLGLARLGMAADGGVGLLGREIEIRGDTDTGQRFREALAGVEPDWEEWLARLAGDAAAHQIGGVVRGARAFLARSAATLSRDLGEYLQEEARLLPTAIEVDNFMVDVDHLRVDADRLAARVARLAAHLAAGGGVHR